MPNYCSPLSVLNKRGVEGPQRQGQCSFLSLLEGDVAAGAEGWGRGMKGSPRDEES